MLERIGLGTEFGYSSEQRGNRFEQSFGAGVRKARYVGPNQTSLPAMNGSFQHP